MHKDVDAGWGMGDGGGGEPGCAGSLDLAPMFSHRFTLDSTSSGNFQLHPAWLQVVVD